MGKRRVARSLITCCRPLLFCSTASVYILQCFKFCHCITYLREACFIFNRFWFVNAFSSTTFVTAYFPSWLNVAQRKPWLGHQLSIHLCFWLLFKGVFDVDVFSVSGCFLPSVVLCAHPISHLKTCSLVMQLWAMYWSKSP